MGHILFIAATFSYALNNYINRRPLTNFAGLPSSGSMHRHAQFLWRILVMGKVAFIMNCMVREHTLLNEEFNMNTIGLN